MGMGRRRAVWWDNVRGSVLEFLQSIAGYLVSWPLQETTGAVSLADNIAVALGRELVINGDFASDISSWAAWITPDTLEWSAGRLHCVGDTSDGANQTVPREASKTYTTSFDYEVISGSIRLVATGLVTSGTLSGTGSFSDTSTATTTGDENTIFQALANGTEFYIDNVTVKQTDILASSAYPGAELLVDGDMEAVGVADWTAQSGATLTKEAGTRTGGSGTQVLQVEIAIGDAVGRAEQVILTVGKRYRAIGWARGDGVNGFPIVLDDSILWTGITSTDWQSFDFEFVADATQFRLRVSGDVATTDNAQFDDCTVTEANPLNGDGTGTTPGVAGGGNIQYMWGFDGATSFDDISSAELNSIFDPTKGTIIVAARVANAGVWTDGVQRRLLVLRVDANYQIFLRKDSGNNSISWFFVANGVAESVTKTSYSPTGIFVMSLTWAYPGNMTAYINDAQEGTPQAIANAFVGNLSATETVIGALDTVPANVWHGDLAYTTLYNEALTQPEIAAIVKSMGV